MVLKGERANLWVKYRNTISAEDKKFILERINLLSDEISTLYGQRKACNRIIETYENVYIEIKKCDIQKEKMKSLLNKEKQKKIVYR